jgi:hypothetical protein
MVIQMSKSRNRYTAALPEGYVGSGWLDRYWRDNFPAEQIGQSILGNSIAR